MPNDFNDPPSSTRERVALLELRLDYCARSVEETRRIVQDLDSKFDELVLQLARDRKASLPPKKTTSILTGGAKQSIGGALGAAILYLLQQLVTPAAPPAPAPTHQK
jgi:hypothetical protein